MYQAAGRAQLTLTLKMEAIFSPKRLLTFTGLHGVTSQKLELFRIINIYIHKETNTGEMQNY
jgi:hypothetical protein